MTCRRTILRSTAIGGFIGMVPGVGQVVAAFMGYSAAQSASSHPETFGKGESRVWPPRKPRTTR